MSAPRAAAQLLRMPLSLGNSFRPTIALNRYLRRPRRVPAAQRGANWNVARDSFRPLNAGGDIAARCRYHSVPQDVAGIAARILHEILLVVFLRRIEFCCCRNLSCDGPFEFARFVPPRLDAFRGLFL